MLQLKKVIINDVTSYHAFKINILYHDSKLINKNGKAANDESTNLEVQLSFHASP